MLDGTDSLRKTNLPLIVICTNYLLSISDPDYCTRYYRCSHGVDQGFECPKGTAWEDESKSCAWIEHVNCEQKKLDYSTSTTTEGMSFDSTNGLFPSF